MHGVECVEAHDECEGGGRRTTRGRTVRVCCAVCQVSPADAMQWRDDGGTGQGNGGVVGRCVDVATYSNAERAQAPRLSEQTGVSRARE